MRQELNDPKQLPHVKTNEKDNHHLYIMQCPNSIKPNNSKTKPGLPKANHCQGKSIQA